MLMLPVLVVWSLVDMIRLHFNCRVNRFVAIYDVMFAMFTAYGLLLVISPRELMAEGMQIEKTAYLVKVLPSLLPFYTIYRNTLITRINLDKILSWLIIFIVVAVFDYFLQLKNTLMIHFGASDIAGADEIVNNGAYTILGLLPILCLAKRKLVQIGCIISCLYLIITAFKRGPILISTVCVLYYVFYTVNSSKRKLWVFVLVIIAFVVGYHFLMNFLMSSDLLQARLELTMEGYSSQRDDIASSILAAFGNSSFLNILFGHGAYGTVSVVGRLAHNDWLQILFDQGIMGILVHVLFCWQLLVNWRKTEREDNAKLAIGMVVIIYFLTTLFSMAFDRIPLYEMTVLAYIVATNDMKYKRVQ